MDSELAAGQVYAVLSRCSHLITPALCGAIKVMLGNVNYTKNLFFGENNIQTNIKVCSDIRNEPSV